MVFAKLLGISASFLLWNSLFAQEVSGFTTSVSNELTAIRKSTPGPFSGKSFKDIIDEQVDSSLSGQHPFSGWWKKAFKISSPTMVGLGTHPVCSVKAVKLAHGPSKGLASTIKRFAVAHNSALSGGDTNRLGSLWRKFFYCLAKEESLSNPDNKIYDLNAKRFGIRRPRGVVFHSDKQHVSGNSIGVFQFAPVMNGNIRPCIELWNEKYPAFKLPLSGDLKLAAKILGDSSQAFNIFCGVNKVVQSFYVQINSKNFKYVNSEKECVTFNRDAYMHFGPLMNSTGRNLESVLKCAI